MQEIEEFEAQVHAAVLELLNDIAEMKRRCGDSRHRPSDKKPA